VTQPPRRLCPAGEHPRIRRRLSRDARQDSLCWPESASVRNSVRISLSISTSRSRAPRSRVDRSLSSCFRSCHLLRPSAIGIPTIAPIIVANQSPIELDKKSLSNVGEEIPNRNDGEYENRKGDYSVFHRKIFPNLYEIKPGYVAPSAVAQMSDFMVFETVLSPRGLSTTHYYGVRPASLCLTRYNRSIGVGSWAYWQCVTERTEQQVRGGGVIRLRFSLHCLLSLIVPTHPSHISG